VARVPQAAEDSVLFPVWSLSEVQRVGIAETDSVSEYLAPQAVNFDRFPGIVAQIIPEGSGAQIKRREGSVTEITDKKRSSKGPEIFGSYWRPPNPPHRKLTTHTQKCHR